MRELAGTSTLLRLALRRDRITTPVWFVALIGLLAAQVAGLASIYNTEEQRENYARVNVGSVPARMFGSVDGPTLGSITMVEIYGFLAVMVALMSTFMVVRHTRRNEETGRLELVGAGVVGRHASLVAALVLACAVNATLVASFTVVLVACGLPAQGSLMMATALGGTGIAFAAVAAVTAQVCSSARVANGLAGLAVAAAFLLRGVGDVFGSARADGMGIEIAWTSWLSPIGWGQLAYPFGETRWAAILAYPLAFAGLAWLAVALSARRDIGHGMVTPRRRPESAAAYLRTPLALAVRLQRGTILAWSAVALALGLIVGGFAGEVEAMLGDNEQAAELFGNAGGSDVLLDNYYAIMATYAGLTIAGFALQSVLRLRSEEAGPLENVLATAVTRRSWVASHVTISLGGSVLLLAITTAAAVASSVAAGQGDRSEGVVLSMVVQLPAIAVMGAFAVLGFGIAARWSALLGWGLFGLCVLVLIGEMIDLPGWLVDLSPFAHVPLVPNEDVAAAPLLALAAIAGLMLLAGFLGFRRRDVGGT